MSKLTVKPILFSTSMVISINEDRKSQTRRMQGLQLINKDPESFGLGTVRINGYFNFYKKYTEKGIMILPKYQEGDILWVRETWHKIFDADTNIFLKYGYKAEWSEGVTSHPKNKGIWNPSIFMPKEAARTFLKVTNVRCERLSEISDKDARAEGIEIIPDYYWTDGALNYMYGEDRSYQREYFFLDGNYGIGKLQNHNGLVASFLSLFAKINSWELVEKNPWVWVYEFEKIEKPLNWPL